MDITTDTDVDGDPVNDDDASCNKVMTIPFVPTSKQQIARIHYAADGSRQNKDITLVFLDYEDVLPEEYEWAAEELDASIGELMTVEPRDPLGYYKDLLINLRASLGETDEMNSVLLQLRDLISERPQLLTDEQRENILMLINALSDETVQQVS
jgi:hypothetical protein